MNYLAHGRPFLEHPYLLAGTAVPDWLSVVDRRSRARSRLAHRFLGSRDQRVSMVAAGILRHHRDDDWFHRSRAFSELSWSFTVAIRDRLPRDDGFRPSFLGHILVEILLDAELMRFDSRIVGAYYGAVERLDVDLVGWAVSRMATRPVPSLAAWIERFSQERFLNDYQDDAKLLFRLNLIMRRVGLPPIPDSLVDWFSLARQAVRPRIRELLPDEKEEPA
jgi:hypothetical protein